MGAFATAGRWNALLFATLARAAEQCITRGLDKFKTLDLSNMVWAFATTTRSDVLLFAILSRAAEGHQVDDFNPQHLANAAWAFATVGEPAPLLRHSISVLETIEGQVGDSKLQMLHY